MTLEKLKSEIANDLGRKMRTRCSSEIAALQAAQKAREDLNAQIQSIHHRIDAATDELSKLEDRAEKLILEGNTPNSEIRQVSLQKATIETLGGQVKKLTASMAETDTRVNAAATVLVAALKREIPAERDAEEERIQALLDQAMNHVEAWTAAVKATFDDLGLLYDPRADKRLCLLYGLTFDALTMHQENLRDSFYWQGKKQEREARAKARRAG